MTLIISQVRSLVLHNLLLNRHNIHSLHNQIVNRIYIIYIYIYNFANATSDGDVVNFSQLKTLIVT